MSVFIGSLGVLLLYKVSMVCILLVCVLVKKIWSAVVSWYVVTGLLPINYVVLGIIWIGFVSDIIVSWFSWDGT